MTKLERILDQAPDDEIIKKSITTTYQKLKEYDSVFCSVSGGSDSDLVLDLLQKLKGKKKIKYAFFDTGLEYQATKRHIEYLNRKYRIEIDRVRAVKPVPVCCREYGQPFLSKRVSENISRLQAHGFQWEDTDDLEELLKIYPNCRSALKWWCNCHDNVIGGRVSSLNINYNAYLKEYIVANPPQFKISNKCCKYAKKNVAEQYLKKEKYDLNIDGVRKAEGGARKAAFKSCFTSKVGNADDYRPIFWYKETTKRNYEEGFNIVHSECYTTYGLKRTGCAGCPFGKKFEEELSVMREFEPNLYTAATNIFGDSYAYTRAYREYVRERRAEVGDR